MNKKQIKIKARTHETKTEKSDKKTRKKHKWQMKIENKCENGK